MPTDLIEGRPALNVMDKNGLQQILRHRRQLLTVISHTHAYVLVYLVGSRRLEWRLTGDQFTDENSQRPNIDSVVVTTVRQHLGRLINHRPTESVCLLHLFEQLSKPEVDKLDVASVLH